MGLNDVGGGWGWGSRPWIEGGHCPGSCSGWLSWSGWLPQFSARTLRPFFRLWCLPSLMRWVEFWTWIAIPFMGSPRFTACLCSLSLTFSILLVSPKYTSGQFLQGISYATPFCFCSEVLFFTCISSLFGVFFGLKTGFTPRGAQSFSIFSLTPLMWPVHSILGASSSCCGSRELSGRANGGSSSPGFLGTHFPGTPD